MNATPGFPTVNHLSKPFWDAASKHELKIQKCQKCSTYVWYPKAWCSECGSLELKWTKVAGYGTIYSYTVIRHTRMNPIFLSDAPYNIVAVELDEGPRMYSWLVHIPLESITLGMRVKVSFVEWNSLMLPVFEADV